MKTTHNKKKAKIYLVGAGPGGPGLITVRGAEVLKRADCVICDRLVNPTLLRYVGADAEIIRVPKRIGEGCFTQEQINKLLLEKAGQGQIVVRLKGGDPCIFARAAEEAATLAEAGIDFEIVPGVTAGVAAGEYAGIVLTGRDYSSQVVFVTGQEAEGKRKSSIDWHWLAKFKGTIVFYMAMGNLEFITSELMKNDMDEEVPVAAIADATLPSQRVIKQSLRLIAEKCKEQKIEPPVIVIIGAAARSEPGLNWFMKKPLFGRNIVVTRDRCGNADFANKIISEGGNPIEFATIKIKPLTQTNEFLQTLAKITEFDWVIFTSANGAAVFFDCLRSLGKDARVFDSIKIAAIGGETAAKLSEFGVKADFAPSIFTCEELAKQLIGFANLQGKKVLLLRSKLASDELVKLLKQAGAKVEGAAVYTAVTEKSESEELRERFSDGRIDWLTFASPSSVKGFFEQIPIELVSSSNIRVASIGPVTSEQLKSLGIEVDLQASEHTIDGIVAALKGIYR